VRQLILTIDETPLCRVTHWLLDAYEVLRPCLSPGERSASRGVREWRMRWRNSVGWRMIDAMCRPTPQPRNAVAGRGAPDTAGACIA